MALLETLALLALGVGLLGLHLPTSAGRWLTLAWVLVLGAATCSMLGVAVSSLIKVTTRSAVAVLNLPYLVLSFISGVYFVFSQLPGELAAGGGDFPLKWICQGLRSAFLPDKLLVAEPAHSWEHGRIALVLGAWLVASLVICIRTFRWQETAGGDGRPAETSPTAQVDAWTVGERRWDLYFIVVLVATIGITQVAGPRSEFDRLAASATLAAMVPWYLFVGRPAMYSDRELVSRGTIYLIGLVPLLVLAQVFASSITFILLALCPQCFMIVKFRRAVAVVVALSLTQPLVAFWQGAAAAEVESLIGIAVAGIAFSIAFGSWIMKIIGQSTERAELIAQLEQTRAELANVNREAGVLAERERLAGEIHDTIAQGFTSIVMLLRRLRR